MLYDSSSVEWWQFLYVFGIMWATGLMMAGLVVRDRWTAIQLMETRFGKLVLIWVTLSILGTGYLAVPMSFLASLVTLFSTK